MPRRLWSESELIAVLSLYCQLPFGKMHHRNPAIQALAQLLNRSPSAVALKLVNFASLDPTLQKRGIKGMSNASKADVKIWSQYFGQWDQIATASQSLQLTDVITNATDMSSVIKDIRLRIGTDRMTMTKSRVGQDFFRNAVLAAYNGRCCITGMGENGLLRASHIIPWAVDTQHRLDPRNGLCLNALHDAAFDRGLITIASDMTVSVSSRLQRKMPTDVFRDSFAQYVGKPVSSPEKFGPLDEYLAYHRTKVFKP